MSEPPSGMSQAQAGQTKQRAAGHSPRSDPHAPVLDELPIVVVQGTPDQSVRRLGLMHPVPKRSMDAQRTFSARMVVVVEPTIRGP